MGTEMGHVVTALFFFFQLGDRSDCIHVELVRRKDGWQAGR